MAVISKYNHFGRNITKVNQQTIRNINVNGVDYHFAEKNEVTDGKCVDAVNEPIRDMQIQGNSYQQTYSGKNLLDLSKCTIRNLIKTEDGYLANINNTRSAYIIDYDVLPKIFINSLGQTFTFSVDNNYNYLISFVVHGTITDGKTYQEVQVQGNSVTLTLSNTFTEITHIEFRPLRASGNYTNTTDVIKDIMVEKSSTKTEYEPYVGGVSVPNPNYPQEIQSVGEKTQNICEETLNFTANGNVSVEAYKNGFKATAKEGASGYNNSVKSSIILHLNKLEWGKTYTLSCYVEQTNSNMDSFLRVGYIVATSNVWKDFGTQKAINNSINVITFTLPDEQPENMGEDKGMYGRDGVQILVNVQREVLDTLETITVTDIMLVEGEQSADYEPSNKYKVPIKISGKNLFDGQTDSSYSGSGTPNISNNPQTSPRTYNEYGGCAFAFNVEGGKTYTINADFNASGSGRFVLSYRNDRYGSGDVSNWNVTFPITVKVPQDKNWIIIAYWSDVNDNTLSWSNIQCEEGDKATAYAEPIDPIIKNIYLNEPLRKVGV